MIGKVGEALEFLQKNGFEKPAIGIILGTGLGALANKIEVIKSVAYGNIPHFPLATVEFHKGKLIYGKLEGKLVVAMEGRFHYYEGYSAAEVVFPVRVMKELGIEKLLVSNAAGSLNLNWNKSDLMLIDDHINLLPDNPLRAHGAASFGQIFTDMSQPYDQEMNQVLKSIAVENSISMHEGVYVAVAGPNLETRAEYRFLRQIGADVVGMSTVPEVIAANQMGLPVSAVSVLTDDCDPDNLKPINIEDIIATAKLAEKDLVTLFRELVRRL
ncbi:MAG: purine-nucleoside phosphorylase [Cytophagales bacterium]|nr:purine-nucleoside phosphorylase [Cytophagales bacterium]